MPWHLVIKAVEAVTDARWVLLYVRRWLKAPIVAPDGTMVMRDKGTPQGSAVSPVLANLFMHYAFDMWMGRHFPSVEFERYADDIIVHCVSKRQAEQVLAALDQRMKDVGLRLHSEKTRVVYCKDGKRRTEHEHTSFTFLGFTFRQRQARDRAGKQFSAFLPAMSREAIKAKGTELRRMRIHRRTGDTLDDLARWLNPIVSGWMQYYGRFYRSAMYPLLVRVSSYLMRWSRKKFRRLRIERKRAHRWWLGLVARQPRLFAHWVWVRSYAAG